MCDLTSTKSSLNPVRGFGDSKPCHGFCGAAFRRPVLFQEGRWVKNRWMECVSLLRVHNRVYNSRNGSRVVPVIHGSDYVPCCDVLEQYRGVVAACNFLEDVVRREIMKSNVIHVIVDGPIIRRSDGRETELRSFVADWREKGPVFIVLRIAYGYSNRINRTVDSDDVRMFSDLVTREILPLNEISGVYTALTLPGGLMNLLGMDAALSSLADFVRIHVRPYTLEDISAICRISGSFEGARRLWNLRGCELMSAVKGNFGTMLSDIGNQLYDVDDVVSQFPDEVLELYNLGDEWINLKKRSRTGIVDFEYIASRLGVDFSLEPERTKIEISPMIRLILNLYFCSFPEMVSAMCLRGYKAVDLIHFLIIGFLEECGAIPLGRVMSGLIPVESILYRAAFDLSWRKRCLINRIKDPIYSGGFNDVQADLIERITTVIESSESQLLYPVWFTHGPHLLLVSGEMIVGIFIDIDAPHYPREIKLFESIVEMATAKKHVQSAALYLDFRYFIDGEKSIDAMSRERSQIVRVSTEPMPTEITRIQLREPATIRRFFSLATPTNSTVMDQIVSTITVVLQSRMAFRDRNYQSY